MKPIRFGIVGEYQSGKSLLINCLLQRPIATVGVGIATTHAVINYRYAQKEYVEYVDDKCNHHTIPIEQIQYLDTATDIMVIDVYLANNLMKNYILTDMPGFGANNDDNNTAKQALRHIDFAILVVSNDKTLGADSSAFKDIRLLRRYKIPYYFILNCRNTDRWRPDEKNNRNIAKKDLALLDFYKPTTYPLEEDGINIVNFMWYWYSLCKADDELLNRREIHKCIVDYEISEEVKCEVGETSNFCLINKLFDMENRVFLELKRSIKEEIDSLRRELCPIGTIQAFAFLSVPEEWMCCNGQILNKEEYADLFNVIGYTFGGKGETFALPDLCGRFVRGWDNAGNIDQNRIFGSIQDDALQIHKHGFDEKQLCISEAVSHRHPLWCNEYETVNGVSGLVSSDKAPRMCYPTNTSGSGKTDLGPYAGAHTHNITSLKTPISNPRSSNNCTIRTGKETRPKNVALMFCIKVK